MKYIKGIFTALLVVNLSVFSTVKTFSQETIHIGIGEMPPYASEHLEHYGFFCHIITEIFAKENITVKYEIVPWKRAIVMSERGKMHGTPGWYSTPEREKIFYVSDPLVDDTQSFFHLKAYKFDWNTIEDLKGTRIGATLGYNYGEAFAKAEKEGKIYVERIAEDERNFRKLLKKRIDIFPMNTFTGYSMLKRMFKPETISLFTHHPKPVRVATLHLLLSRNIPINKELVRIFNKGLKALRESGRYDVLFMKHCKK